MMRAGQALADGFLAVWLVAFLAWTVGRRAGRLAGRHLVELVAAHGSAALVVAGPALLLAWVVYR